MFQDSEKDIVKDVTEHQTQNMTKEDQPNNMEQNYYIQSQENGATPLNEYADVTGTYIYAMYDQLMQIEPLFRMNDEVSDLGLERARQATKNILNEYENYSKMNTPDVFEGFQDVHSVTIYEIELLHKALNEMNPQSQDTNSLDTARRHYENAIMSHQLMEREFLSLSDELGLY